MILLADIGNTRIKLALWDGALRVQDAIVHDDRPLDIFEKAALPKVESVHLSIVPRLRDAGAWTRVVQSRCGVVPHIALAQAEWHGLRNVYAEPQKLGVDRWLAMVALWQERRAPFCVVSAGTAITVDRVDAQGQHLGGIIAPGFTTMQQTMLKTTVTPPTAETVVDDRALGRDSTSAIRQGALFAAIGAIEHAMGDASERCVITGGDASLLRPLLRGDWQQRDVLVLEGLLAQATAK